MRRRTGSSARSKCSNVGAFGLWVPPSTITRDDPLRGQQWRQNRLEHEQRASRRSDGEVVVARMHARGAKRTER